MPKISIILTSYNHERYIREAIESVLNQSYSDFELIILDDASSDNSWEIINDYIDPRIKAYRSEINLGPVDELNKAIFEKTSGEYVAIHHSDDIWCLDKLQKQTDYLDKFVDVAAVFTWVQIIDENSIERDDNWFKQEHKNRWQWLNSLFFMRNQLAHPSVLIRKKCYQDLGGYKRFLAQTPDAEMWSRLLIKNSIYVIPESLTKHRLFSNKSNTSGDRPEVLIRVFNEWNYLRKNFLTIDNFDDLVAIFPIVESYRNANGFNINFLVAMVCLYECKDQAAWNFGLSLLFDLVRDHRRAAEIEALYSFSHKDLIKLTSKIDIYAIGSLSDSSKKKSELTHATNDADQNSTSLAQLLAEKDAHIVSLSASKSDKDNMINVQVEEISERDNKITSLTQELTEVNAKMVILTQKIYQIDRESTKHSADILKYRNEIESLRSSLSWKVTAPLRVLRRRFLLPALAMTERLKPKIGNVNTIPEYQDLVSAKKNELNDIADAPFSEFINSYLDFDAYLEAYPDVKAAGLNPVQHWLNHGIFEKRKLFPDAVVITEQDKIGQLTGRGWRYFTWRGISVAVQIATPFKKSLMKQIHSQGRHDPAVLASGALAIEKLRQFNGVDLLDRDGVNVNRIFGEIGTHSKNILIIPFLCVGGAEKYASDLVDGLHMLGQGQTMVVVTESTAQEAHGWEDLNILAPLRNAKIIFWRDICGPGHSNPSALARLLNVLRPEQLFVINSRLGLDVIARFGRGISQFSKIYCAYFSLGVLGLGVPYGTRYPRRTQLFSTSITDNSAMADSLRRLWDGRVIELQPRVEVAAKPIFQMRLQTRLRSFSQRRGQRRWVWISRVEAFKGTAVLAEIAKILKDDCFDIYGPVHGTLLDLGLTSPNIKYCGILPDVLTANFAEYDGFLFTSLFEGLPNIVLEMSQQAIPMILADVGGLRGTFDDTSVKFVKHSESVDESGFNFSNALNIVAALSSDELSNMLEAAYDKVMHKHAPEVHIEKISQIFGIRKEDV